MWFFTNPFEKYDRQNWIMKPQRGKWMSSLPGESEKVATGLP